jgi:excisionase family DNA binding protein
MTATLISHSFVKERRLRSRRALVDADGSSEYNEVLDSAGAAELLMVSVDALHRARRAGHIPAAKVGRGYRYSRVALLALLDQRAPEPPAE